MIAQGISGLVPELKRGQAALLVGYMPPSAFAVQLQQLQHDPTAQRAGLSTACT
jgi:hypothetical protein